MMMSGYPSKCVQYHLILLTMQCLCGNYMTTALKGEQPELELWPQHIPAYIRGDLLSLQTGEGCSSSLLGCRNGAPPTEMAKLRKHVMRTPSVLYKTWHSHHRRLKDSSAWAAEYLSCWQS